MKFYDGSIKYANAIKEALKDSGKTLTDFEKDRGISRGYVKRCMVGANHLSIDVIKDAERYLGIESIEDYVK